MAWFMSCWKRWKIFSMCHLLVICIIINSFSLSIGEATNDTATSKYLNKISTQSINTDQQIVKEVKNQVVLESKTRKTETLANNNGNGNIGFAAEWEWKDSPSKSEDIAKNKPFPSSRIGAATWHDNIGNWWVFGGHQLISKTEQDKSKSPSVSSSEPKYLNDLWVYNMITSNWDLIFKPGANSFPENISEPLICGSKSSNRVAVFGKASKSESTTFTGSAYPQRAYKDNMVWIYESKGNGQHTFGSWTPFKCCDNCQCPKLDDKALVWCDNSGIMVLQPSAVISIPSDDREYTKAKTTFTGVTSNPVVNDDIGMLNWWKFDMDSKHWIKLPPVKIPTNGQAPSDMSIIFNGMCRDVTAFSNQLVYILCLSSTSSLDLSVFLFDSSSGTASILGKIHLNNAFTDKSIWQPDQSILHALHIPENNITVIFLAYHKLLDLWIHDHSVGKLYSVENVWKANSLQIFEDVNQFYKLSVSIKGSPKIYSFFMQNPRNQSVNFSPNNQKSFHITIVPDKEVFLPKRDVKLLKIPPKYSPHLKNKYKIFTNFLKDKQQKRIPAVRRTRFSIPPNLTPASILSSPPSPPLLLNLQTEMLPVPEKLDLNLSTSTISSSSSKLIEAVGATQDDHHVRNPGNMLISESDSSEVAKSKNTKASSKISKEGSHESTSSSTGSDSIVVDPKIFFAVTLSIFASAGTVLFIRRCVKCPVVTSGEDGEPCSLSKNSPTVRYSFVSDDFGFHTPLV